MLSVRPKVAELAYHVYGRPLHPELFEIHAQQVFQRAGYKLQLSVTSAGHVICLTRDEKVLTEVAGSAQHLLPKRRCLVEGSLSHSHHETLDFKDEISYDSQFSLDAVPSTMFLQLQEEIEQFGTENALFHGFDSSGRIAHGAFSFMHVQAREESVMVKSVHTFPDDQLVVKSVSRFSWNA